MDEETTAKLRTCLSSYDLKFVKQLRQFLKLLTLYNIPIEQVYKYAEDTHQQHVNMAQAKIEMFKQEKEFIMSLMPKCPKCTHVLELIYISDEGDKTPNNLYGYKYMYYCENCLYEEFKRDRTFQQEIERLTEISKENSDG